MVYLHSPRVFQSLMVLSAEVEARRRPSEGEVARERSQEVWPVRVETPEEIFWLVEEWVEERMSWRMMDLSSEPEKRNWKKKRRERERV